MRATVMYGAGDVRIENVPDPQIIEPTDAVIRVTRACVCGSDLWPYQKMERCDTGRVMGHEAIGVVEDVGKDVRTIKRGDFVIMPFAFSDGTCAFCHDGLQTSCIHGGFFGSTEVAGAQAEAVRIPLADGTLFPLGAQADDALMPSLLSLSDVMGTGHHAAVAARVGPGKIVAVVGDGAVGLSAILAAKRLGAARIIALSRNPTRQALAREFGATDVVAERADAAIAAVLELTGGIGVDATLECVGTNEAMTTALAIARPGSTVGYVGVPHGVEVSVPQMFRRNVGLKGGPAPVRAYLPELLADVLAGTITPGRVFDFETDLEHVADAYAAMDERRAIKALVRVGSVA